MIIDIIQALNDKRLLGQFFKDPATWRNWFCFLRAFFGLSPREGDKEIFSQCTGRQIWPKNPSNESWVIAGRRSGKSYVTALLATFLAVFREYDLSPGEIGHVLVIAPTGRQASVIKRYISGFFNENRYLKSLLHSETQEEIRLFNRINILILPADYRSIRGFTAIACIVDEIGYFFAEGARPDFEVIRAIRPMLASSGGPLLAISTPYAKRGSLYTAWKSHYAQEHDEVLIWQAPSLLMNPTLSQKVIDKARLEDPEGSISEWDAEFRSDIESFVSREAIEQCIAPGRYELPYISCNNYRAFVDPSGGSKDSMTLAISHIEDGIKILDAIRERKPPFSPDQVCKDFAELLKSYHISSITGDRYGGEWPRERFRKYGINYEVCSKPKSDLYRDLLPLINSGKVELLDNQKMISQLINLERRTGRGGRDSIDHPPNAHDDLINSVAGALLSAKEWVCPVVFVDSGNLSGWLNGDEGNF